MPMKLKQMAYHLYLLQSIPPSPVIFQHLRTYLFLRRDLDSLFLRILQLFFSHKLEPCLPRHPLKLLMSLTALHQHQLLWKLVSEHHSPLLLYLHKDDSLLHLRLCLHTTLLPLYLVLFLDAPSGIVLHLTQSLHIAKHLHKLHSPPRLLNLCLLLYCLSLSLRNSKFHLYPMQNLETGLLISIVIPN